MITGRIRIRKSKAVYGYGFTLLFYTIGYHTSSCYKRRYFAINLSLSRSLSTKRGVTRDDNFFLSAGYFCIGVKDQRVLHYPRHRFVLTCQLWDASGYGSSATSFDRAVNREKVAQINTVIDGRHSLGGGGGVRTQRRYVRWWGTLNLCQQPRRSTCILETTCSTLIGSASENVNRVCRPTKRSLTPLYRSCARRKMNVKLLMTRSLNSIEKGPSRARRYVTPTSKAASGSGSRIRSPSLYCCHARQCEPSSYYGTIHTALPVATQLPYLHILH